MNEKARILIVDDNQSLSRSIALILKHEGYAADIADDGLQAIEKVKAQPYDLIFMDIKMPFMDGAETHRQIKAIRPEAVVMLMTAYAVEDLIQQALQDGAYGVLYKPLDIDRMFAVIEEARARKNGALIMVVDDDEATCAALLNILNRKGYQVGIAHSGEEAIAKARETAHEILFIDMKLPSLNGLETYLAIRDINPGVVAIMITGYRQEMAELVEEALHNGAYTCLYKPIEIDEMLQIIEEICRRKRMGEN